VDIPVSSASPVLIPSKLKMVPSKTTTPRCVIISLLLLKTLLTSIASNLCAVEWCADIGGTKDEFAAYWKSIKGTEQEKVSTSATAVHLHA